MSEPSDRVAATQHLAYLAIRAGIWLLEQHCKRIEHHILAAHHLGGLNQSDTSFTLIKLGTSVSIIVIDCS